MPPAPLLKIDHVSKQFGRVQALRNVSLTLEHGRIYGLAGENGAGKSTLVNLLCGVHHPDSGTLQLDGELYAPSNPAEAEEAGIRVFHQEIPICPNLSVAANVFLGSTSIFPNWREMERQCEAWFDQWLGFTIDPRRLLRDCTIAERQMALLVRVLSRTARMIILDEPTTALTPPETAHFFGVIRRLQAQGITFLFVSHFLHELTELSDLIHVLRDGQLAGSLEKGHFDPPVLTTLIAGRNLEPSSSSRALAANAASRLEVRGLSKAGAFHDVSFAVRAGEILGITGVQGSGRSEIARSLFGSPPAEAGYIWVNGESARIRAPRDAIALGIGYVPEDRQELGLFDDLDVQTNLGISRLAHLSRGGILSRARLRELTLAMREKLGIRLSSVQATITSLSGGNQQKVLIARWLAIQPSVLVLNEPTRGVDIGAKNEICGLLHALAQTGCAIIVASADLDEVMRLSHRILVLAGGRKIEEFERSAVTKALLIAAVGTTESGGFR